ncbi:MAG TPA: amino acid adenylation domain-containing protein [Ktedonobacteraceae bacterium]|nr:amino acid adenylation domain-containing protein [Ktedonobacteraceae bacterium]
MHDSLTSLAIPRLYLDAPWPAVATRQAACSTPAYPQNPAYIIYTSGSTGQPKGVMVTHSALVSRIQAFQRVFQLSPQDRHYQFMSLNFDASAEEIYLTLCNGATLVLAEAAPAEGVLDIWQDARRLGLTKLDLPTAAWHEAVDALVKDPRSFPETLQAMAVGGEALSLDKFRLWAEYLPQPLRFFNMYGPTEATISATHFASLPGQDELPQRISIGRPFASTRIYLLDQDLQPVAENQPGEIFIGGAGIARGYVLRPDLTAEGFLPDPFSPEPGARMYRTGDLARLLVDGNLEFLGRVDSQVKIRGFRIEPGEIEAILRQHPAVAGALVLPWEETPGQGEKRLVAYIAPHVEEHIAAETSSRQTSDGMNTVGQQAAISPERSLPAQLRAYLGERLPHYMIPAMFLLLEAFPLTPGGKIDRNLLPSPAQEYSETGIPYVAPRTPLEKTLAAIWQRVLKIPRVGIHDNFFELGGHSLMATRAISHIRETLHVALSLRTFFAIPSIAELAAHLEAQASVKQPASVATFQAFAREENIQLSFAQLRLWFLDQLESGNPFYNISAAIRLAGRLQVPILERCFSEIMARHEVLRTSFATLDGKPRQVIAPPMPLDTLLIDLSSLSSETQALAAKQLERAEGKNPFDLSKSPLFRTKLLRLNKEHHILLLSMHHIVSDDWSMEIFFHELSTLYEAFAKGEPSPLPPLALQYVDYALWQRKWFQEGVLEEQLSYWRDQLGDLPLLQLPIDHPYPPSPTHRGANWSFVIPPDLTRAIRRLCQQEQTTLFMTLLAAFQVLLYRHSGQDDIVVGSPIANRMRSEVKDLIGFFVNTLVFRTRLADTQTVRAYLKQVRQVALDAYAHQDVPFEQIVEELQPERNLIRHPLFQAAFALLNEPVLTQNISNLTWHLLDTDNGTAKFDLTLFMRDEKERLIGTFEYNADIFEARTVARIAEHFCTLLQGMVAAPECKLADLPILTAPERTQLLTTWNATQTAYPSDRCVPELFEEQVRRSPDTVAVSYGDAQLTYHELNRRANQLAHALQKSGVGPEVTVGVCLERSPELITAFLGILKAGGVYLPLDLAYPDTRRAFLLQNAHAAALLTQHGLHENLADYPGPIIYLDTDWAYLESEHTSNPQNTATAANLAYIIYTSGSTGQPKGVAVAHQAIARLVCNTNYVKLDCADRIAQASNEAFDAATFEIWGALLHGGRLVGVTKETALNPQALARVLREEYISALFVTTALFNQSIKENPCIFHTLKSLLFGGEAVDPRWVRETLEQGAPERLLHVYGPTENTTFSSWYLVQSVSEEAGTIPIGRPLANTQCYVLDQRLQPVPPGVRGELYLGGDGLARGYLGHPELTATYFVPHPFSPEPGARLYKTGDLVHQLADGSIEFQGRVDHQVKLRGFRIELGEIESSLKQHSAVQEAVVIVREDIPGDRRLVAYIVPRPDEIAPQQNVDEDRSNEHIATWQELFDDIYSSSSLEDDADFNITGWNSSYTGQPLPPEHMREWVEHTLEELRAGEPQRVLEIGCGSGLLLFRLAPDSTKYWGTDFSPGALQMVQRHAQKRGLSQVQLLQRMADDFTGMEEQTFDTIILNSVVQYFPSLHYLLDVLAGALQHIALPGTIFLGDLRNQQLLELFHASIELYKCDNEEFPLDQFHQRIHAQMAQETELLLDPAFFYALQERYPQISEVCIRPKRGRYDNELTAFRYNVQLKIGNKAEVARTGTQWLDWQRTDLSLAALHQQLLTHRPALLALTRIPNARMATERETLRLLSSPEPHLTTVGELRDILHANVRNQGVTPEDLHLLGQELGYLVDVRWSGIETDGSFDAVFWQPEASETVRTLSWPHPAQSRPWSQYANQPLREKLRSTSKLAPQLRSYLQERLSDFMVPSSFVVLDTLPLNANGKVDRRALPQPGQARPLQLVEYLAPRNPVEELLTSIWVDVLSIEQIGVQDNFFEIGGHSLLATQVISRIDDTFQVDLPLRTLFEAPTVEHLATALISHETRSGQIATIARLQIKLNSMSAEEIQQTLLSKKQRRG